MSLARAAAIRIRRTLPRHWPRPAILLIGALLLAALGTASVKALTATEPRRATPVTPASTVTPAASRPAVTVRIDAGDYLGEPYGEVRQALLQRGVRVHQVTVDRGGPPGTVSDVSPIGALPVNAMVTVTVVDDKASHKAPEKGGKNKKNEGD
jgi:hypothetical protein